MHLFLQHKSFILVSTRWLLLQRFLPIKKLLGVSASKSFTLSLFAVKWSVVNNIFNFSKHSHHLKVSEDPISDYMKQQYVWYPHVWWAWRIKLPFDAFLISKICCFILVKFCMFQIQFLGYHFEIGSTIRHQCIGFASSIDESLERIYKWLCLKWFYKLQINCLCYHTGKQTAPSH